MQLSFIEINFNCGTLQGEKKVLTISNNALIIQLSSYT